METLVEISGLRKEFGPIKAVNNVSFSVKRGEVLGFLGPNGAGKSTTMKMITCYLTPTAGKATVCGHDILTEPLAVRRKIGYLPEGAPAYSDMTPLGFLRFIAEVRGLSGANKKKQLDRVVEQVGLQNVLHQPIDTLSKGFKRRVGLAQSIIHDPEVLILDEPTDGLDPNQKHDVRNLITQMSENKVIILSTHILEEVDAVCSRAVIIARGCKIFDGTPAQLLAKSADHNVITLKVNNDTATGLQGTLLEMEQIAKVEKVEDCADGNKVYRIVPKNGENIAPLINKISFNNDWKILDFQHNTGRYDDVFRQLTLPQGGTKS
ncbi:MAG: ABC transporter ATP-binding protein [Sumerlaeia bacterium]